MSFEIARERIREAMRHCTRNGTPAGLQLILDFRKRPIEIDIESFTCILRKTLPTLKANDAELLSAFFDPFQSGCVSWRSFISWIRRSPCEVQEACHNKDNRLQKSTIICKRVSAALRRKLFINTDGKFDFCKTFRRMVQSVGSERQSDKGQHEHFLS